jgi:hypothetical protein
MMARSFTNGGIEPYLVPLISTTLFSFIPASYMLLGGCTLTQFLTFATQFGVTPAGETRRKCHTSVR